MGQKNLEDCSHYICESFSVIDWGGRLNLVEKAKMIAWFYVVKFSRQIRSESFWKRSHGIWLAHFFDAPREPCRRIRACIHTRASLLVLFVCTSLSECRRCYLMYWNQRIVARFMHPGDSVNGNIVIRKQSVVLRTIPVLICECVDWCVHLCSWIGKC